MGLKFRRGTTAQQSGSLAFGEPYVNTTLGTLVVGGPTGDIVLGASGTGSTGNFGAISGSGLDITGNANIAGNVTVGGKLTIGDATTDTVNVVASLSSSLIPAETNTFDLGSPTKMWRDLYISTGSIKFVNNAGSVVGTLSLASAGLQLSGDIYAASDGATGVRLGRGAGSNTTFNTALGYATLNSNTTGQSNTAVGATALASNTTGGGNISIGTTAMAANTTGNDNVVVGSQALYLSNGSGNTVIGKGSMFNLNAGNGGNTAIGFRTLDKVSSGDFNIALGYQAGYNSSGSATSNIYIGYQAGPSASYGEGVSEYAKLYINNGSSNTPLIGGDFVQRTVTIDGDLLPSGDNTRDLGSPTKFWRDLYISTGSIKFVGAAGTVVGTLTNVGNGLNLDGGIVTNGNSSFGTSSLSTTTITGSLLVNGNVRVTNGGISGSIAATNGVVSGSSQVISILDSLNTFSGSQLTQNSTLETYTASVESRLSSLGSLSGSFARTNSANTFNGTQTVSGSLYVTQDLVVGGSSSIQNISSSNLIIGAAYVTLNTATPSSRYAGLQIVDSGSSGGSGSFLYDAVQDEFIFVHRGNGTNITSSHFVLGPETYDNLGNETYLTNNRLPKGTGKEHLVDSNITDAGTEISLNSLTSVTGSLRVSAGISGSIAATNGVVSGSSQLTESYDGRYVQTGSFNTYTSSNDTTNTTQNSRLNQLSTASGSAITRLTALEVETSNLESFTSSINTTIKSKLDADGVISGSSQLTTTFDARYLNTGADGVVSGSSQISHDSTTGYSANRHIDHTAVTITAGSGLSGGGDISATRTLSIASGGVTNDMLAGSIANAKLSNSTISGIALGSNLATLTIGTGLSGTSYNGSTAVTIANTGVTSNVAGTGVSVSSGTGAVTISIGQSVATSANAQFNSLGIGMAASATAGRIDATNDIVAYSSSDIRFKENIKAIENPIQKIRQISGNTYDWKAENKIEHGYEGNDVGVIAQEIEAVLPQLVQTRDNGYKAVKYDKLVALLIEGIKEQQIQIDSLTLQMEELKKQKGL